MRTYDVDPKIKKALAALVKGSNPSFSDNRCKFAVEDVLENGVHSLYWEEVSVAANEYFGPILHLLMPVIRQILQAMVPAISIRADEINREAEQKDERHDAGNDGA